MASLGISATQTIRGGATTVSFNPNCECLNKNNPIMVLTSLVNGTDTFAVLHYAGASNAEPTATQPTGLPAGGIEFKEFNLQACTFVIRS
jgi:hypothetical protein